MAGQPEWDAESLELLEDGLRKTMLSASGADLDAALAELGWAEMLSDNSEVAIPLVFRLLGETGSHASVLNDVVLLASSPDEGSNPALPYAGGGWVVWDYAAADESSALGGLPLRRVEEGGHPRLPDARRAVGWWLGAYVGLFTAVVVSAIGTGVGLYYGRRLAEYLL